MTRKAPTLPVLKALLAKSGNRCAFPGCNHPIINESNILVAELIHIEAAEAGGERYNPSQSDDERRGYENLLFMCHRHHVETDNIENFPVARLKTIKADHEQQFLYNPFTLDMSMICKIRGQMSEYWSEVKRANETEHICPDDIKMPIDISITQIQLFDELFETITLVENALNRLSQSDNDLHSEIIAFLKKLGYDTQSYEEAAYYENPFQLRNWELHNIGSPNFVARLRFNLKQLEIKSLENELSLNPNNREIKIRIEASKGEMLEMAKSFGYAD